MQNKVQIIQNFDWLASSPRVKNQRPPGKSENRWEDSVDNINWSRHDIEL